MSEKQANRDVLVFTATYNELGNVEELCNSIWRELPGASILVVDDNSPDGTGTHLEEMKKKNPLLNVIHRYKKLGVGSAHKIAMKYAIANGFNSLITMDADFSHDPKYLKTFLANLDKNDFVIGSRFVAGGRLDYTGFRRFISFGANFLVRALLGVKSHETTTSYRSFRRSLLERLNVDQIEAEGYSFFIECTYRISKATNTILEIPIHFQDRQYGQTKISKNEIYRGFLTLARLFFENAFSKPKQFTTLVSGTTELIDCPVCDSSFQSQLYNATSSTHTPNEYCSTSSSHSSHGRIVKCLCCGLVFTNPQLPEKAIAALYEGTEDHEYAKHIHARYKTFEYNLNAVKHLWPNHGRLLEVGSYCGAFLKTAAEHGYEVNGIEPSAWAADYSRKHYHVNVINSNLSDVDYKNTPPYDLVVSWDVLEHVSDPLNFLKRVNSHLHMGGVFSFSTLDYRNWYPQLLGEKWPWMMDMHLYYFDVPVLKRMAELAGFELKDVRSYCHIITFKYFLSKLDSLGVPGAKFLEKIVGKTFMSDWMIPFRFGDIKLLTLVKTNNVVVESPSKSESRKRQGSNPNVSTLSEKTRNPQLGELPNFVV